MIIKGGKRVIDDVLKLKGWCYSMKFGELLKKIRESRDISQNKLAIAAGFSSNVYISDMERSMRPPTIYSSLIKIIKHLDSIKPIQKYLLLELTEAAISGRRSREDQLLFDYSSKLREECVKSGDVNPKLLGMVTELGRLKPESYPVMTEQIKLVLNAQK